MNIDVIIFERIIANCPQRAINTLCYDNSDLSIAVKKECLGLLRTAFATDSKLFGRPALYTDEHFTRDLLALLEAIISDSARGLTSPVDDVPEWKEVFDLMDEIAIRYCQCSDAITEWLDKCNLSLYSSDKEE